MTTWFRSLMAAVWLVWLPAGAGAQSVATYHNDTLRTGWNSAETSLNVANVRGGVFGLQAMTALDSQVDAQPLVMTQQKIDGQGVHTVVYVVTEGDTLYAIDGGTGAVLKSRNFGVPVPMSALPGQCNNNATTVGITSTPVIDPASGTLYLIAYTYENEAAVYRVHAVSLSTLKDKVAPVVITAFGMLTDGTAYNFNPAVSRQRAALLLSGGTLYAGFSSFCDQETSETRGWLLGWKASNLAPLAHNRLQDTVSPLQSNSFLNSIWMSGYGPSTAAPNSPVFAVTSNSDQTSYGVANRDESVLRFSPDLTSTNGFFTDPQHANLDEGDEDFGSGGAMLIPDQPGQNPQLLFAAGKSGRMFMIDRSAKSGLALLKAYEIGQCWCGPSYFVGPDNIGRVVTSGGTEVIIWKLDTSSGAPPSLVRRLVTPVPSGQDPGFFTSISSDGTKTGTAVVWAVSRPDNSGVMRLVAIDPRDGKMIFSQTAGNWQSLTANANTVPTVANGHVYVASDQELAIFGLGNLAQIDPLTFATANRAAPAPGVRLAAGEHAVSGTVQTVSETDMVLKTRAGALVDVALTAARAAGNMAETTAGEAASVIGVFAPNGVLVANHVEHAKPQPALWPRDQ